VSHSGSFIPRFKTSVAPGDQGSKDNRLREVMAEIDELSGLGTVKHQLEQLIAFAQVVKVKRDRDLPVNNLSMHMVFMGPPGTGKTEVARKVGKMLHSIGLLRRGHVVEVDRSQLVASYVGQTAKLVDAKVDEAKDGVLFIDEAYTLGGIRRDDPDPKPDQYGQEAIDALLKRMEDLRDRLVVIAAGYTAEMGKFLQTNVGLESRFAIRMQFESYTESDLVEIFTNIVKRNRMTTDADAERELRQEIRRLVTGRDESFGNAREMRKLFEKVCQAQAMRLGHMGNLESLSDEDLLRITVEDVRTATD